MRKTGWSSESRHTRGYGAAWDRLRLQVLRRDHGLCMCPECQGGKLRLTIATEVDHRVPKALGGGDGLDNLQAINTDCHKRKTVEENGGKLNLKPKIGLDGYPIR